MTGKTLAILTLLAAICCAPVRADEEPEAFGADDPRARPLVIGVLAVNYQDVELFKLIFSKKIQEGIGEENWPRGLEAYTRELKGFTPEGLGKTKFRFSGDEQQGTLEMLEEDGTGKGELRVIKEDGVWKLNER